MTFTGFTSYQASHAHSLRTLNTLYEYDDFMQSIGTVADFGSGNGLDIEWWATRTTRDLDSPTPLNIKCTAIDILESCPAAHRHRNINYQRHDFEQPIPVSAKRRFDVLWCHDAFQYVVYPFQTLQHWRNSMADGGMMIIIVPQTTNMQGSVQAFDQFSGCYYHWTMVSLIHVLAVSGFDCAGGFYLKDPNDPWLHVIVYKGDKPALDPRSTTWYQLAEEQRLPESCAVSAMKNGFVRQRDLVLPWIDRSNMSMAGH